MEVFFLACENREGVWKCNFAWTEAFRFMFSTIEFAIWCGSWGISMMLIRICQNWVVFQVDRSIFTELKKTKISQNKTISKAEANSWWRSKGKGCFELWIFSLSFFLVSEPGFISGILRGSRLLLYVLVDKIRNLE